MFKDEFSAEWKRLNPQYGNLGDGLKAAFAHAFYEGLYCYFAPLRIAWWLTKYASIHLFNRMLRK
ncbi:MAG: hypothetical protein ACREBY_04840 [Polaromonas sp.]